MFEQTGCKLDWFSDPSANVPLCSSADQIKRLYELMDKVNKWTYKIISKSSGK